MKTFVRKEPDEKSREEDEQSIELAMKTTLDLTKKRKQEEMEGRQA